jgi:membrane fusion protein, copper/silver efflux system
MRNVKSISFGALPIVAIAAVYLATRDRQTIKAASPDSAGGHDHSAMLGPTASAQPITLSASDAHRIGVTFAVAEVQPLEREIRTVGQVTFDESRVTAISLKVDGWIERLYVNATGQGVRAGAPLLAVYSPMLITAQEELFLAKRLVADVADGASEARANATSLLTSARRRLGYLGIAEVDIDQLESSGEVQRAITLRVPSHGFVVEKNVLEGQRVMAGDALYRIADLRTVWLEGEVFERDVTALRLGESVAAELDAIPGRTYRGRIAYIHPTLDPDTRTSRVRIELPNRDLRLKPGMYATLMWSAPAAGASVSVPRSAVVSTGQRHLVFVRRADGKLEPRLVEIGIATDDRIEILRGIKAGDRVVASATFLVDAESNLGTLLGGMGDMPGMDMTSPTKPE